MLLSRELTQMKSFPRVQQQRGGGPPMLSESAALFQRKELLKPIFLSPNFLYLSLLKSALYIRMSQSKTAWAQICFYTRQYICFLNFMFKRAS